VDDVLNRNADPKKVLEETQKKTAERLQRAQGEKK